MIPREGILGVGVSPVGMEQAVETIQDWIERRQRSYVCLAAAHSLMACRRDPELRSIFNRSGLTVPDGMPLVWLLRLKGHAHAGRVYGPDLTLALAAALLEDGRRHYFYGGATGVPERLVRALEERLPGIQIAGAESPPFRDLSPDEAADMVERLNRARADVVWVGLGTGKQERWMAAHRAALEAPVLISTGAAFDFLSGSKPHAPRWVQRSGMEWLFRLLSEPGRLWRRYADYPLFVLLVLAELAGLRRFPFERGEGIHRGER